MAPRSSIALVLASALVLSGCVIDFGPGKPGDYIPLGLEVYNKSTFLHLIWHEIHPNGSISIHLDIVNNGSRTIHRIGYYASFGFYYPSNGTSIPEESLNDLVTYKTIPSRTYAPFHITLHPKTDPFDGIPYYAYYVTINEIDYLSACYRPDGETITTQPCAPSYELPIVTNTGRERNVLPGDLPFQERAWSCCHLRSFPAYDAYPNWAIPATGDLARTVPFPVKNGTVNATLVLRVSLDANNASVPTPANLNLQILDANDTQVGSASARANSSIQVALPSLPSKGIYHARFTARGAPNATVVLEVHVNDGRDWAHDPFKGMKEPWDDSGVSGSEG